MIRKSRIKSKEAPDRPEINADLGLDPTDVPTTGRVFFEGSPLPVATLAGPNHTLLYVNPAFCRLADKTKDDLIGKPFSEVVVWKGCLALLDHVYGTGEAVIHAEPEALKHIPPAGHTRCGRFVVRRTDRRKSWCKWTRPHESTSRQLQ